MVRILTQLDAYGHCLCELILRGFGAVPVADSRFGTGSIPEESLRMSGELSIPPDEDGINEQAERWGKEVARAAGLAAWQS